MPFVQEVDLPNQGAFHAEQIEAVFDLAVMRDQQLREILDRSVKIPVSAAPEDMDELIANIIFLANNLPQIYDEIVAAASSARNSQTSVADATANFHPTVAPDYIRTAGYAAAGDGGGALYKTVGAEPSHASKFSLTLEDGTTVVWYEIASAEPTKAPSTRTALKALPSAAMQSVFLQEAGRQGLFVWNDSDLSAEVTADTEEGVYIAPAFDITGNSGAWVRKYDGAINPRWFGASADGSTNDTIALQAALDMAPLGSVIDLRGESYAFTALTVPKSVSIQNGALDSNATTGILIDVDDAARLKMRGVAVTGGGAATTYQSGNSLIRQNGASTSARAVGIDLEDCNLSGAGYAAVTAKFSDNVRMVDCQVSDCAYVGLQFLSCNNLYVHDNRVTMRTSVGASGNAYGIQVTHDSTGYNSDPGAGTPLAANPFCVKPTVTHNIVVGPTIWEGIDAHGCFDGVVAYNKVYGAKVGIQWGESSGDATGYAGYHNEIVGNLITKYDEDGTAVSGLTTVYGISVGGGSVAKNRKIKIIGNTIVGYGGAPTSSARVPILVNLNCLYVIVADNIITEWAGYAIYIGGGTDTFAVNGNLIEGMSASATNSFAVMVTGANNFRGSVVGNVLRSGGTPPTGGLYINSNVTGGKIVYASEMSFASTEVIDASGASVLRNAL